MDTVDWGTEWITSPLWILGVFVATVIVLGIVVVLLVRLTTWGRQFWRLAGPFVRPRRGERATWRPTVFILVLLLLVVLSVRINLLLSYNTNDLYTSLQNLDSAAFWRALGIFAVIAAVSVGESLVTYYIGQSFVIRLWEDLNGRFLGDWLGERVYHRSRFSATQVDNPDQRIQEDITSFAQTSYSLIARPDVVFLDEATAALDEGLEHELYTLLRRELPDLVLVSVGHRSSLEAFHSRRLDLEGEGRWRM